MKLDVQPGSYIVAVSGGVDSVALLHMLQKLPGLKLTVAHFDHGIRTDSADDELFVRKLASQYGLQYVSERAELGAEASEAVARQARYAFLEASRRKFGAQAIITAHHGDDVLETAILNILRGTARRGLSSLRSTDAVVRPLLHASKAGILSYARGHELAWREDSTNASDAYHRNYIRHHVVPRLSSRDKSELATTVVKMRTTNHQIDELVGELVDSLLGQVGIDRRAFVLLPHPIAREVMAAWLRQTGIQEIDAKLLERLVRAAKTLPGGRRVHVRKGQELRISKEHLALGHIERYNT